MGLVLSLVFLIIILLTASFTYIEGKQIKEQKGHLALELSKTISSMPEIINAFHTDDPAKIIQPLVEKIRKETGAEFIVVGNKQGIRYSHPDPNRIGHKMVGGDNKRALVSGKSYVSKAKGSLGISLRGKSPVLNDKHQVIGIVSVGFLFQDIKEQMIKNIIKVALISLIVLIVAVFVSILLARNIRKETMGLEPYQIAALYKERNAILQAVKEGIIAVDKNGVITMMNQTAKHLLNLRGDFHNKKIEDVFPATRLYEVLQTGEPQTDQEMILQNRTIIVNRTPIFDKNNEEVIGVVASFRDKTEIKQMVNALSEVRRYSEDLRAQTHEFTNKLYVLSGLIQLGEYDKAMDMIRDETAALNVQNRILFDQIKDVKVQAIILGKLGKASEKKIKFNIDTNSSLQSLPEHIKLPHLIIIIGNLIDNAFEAAASVRNAHVNFFTTDLGQDIIFEISDNGMGINEEDIPLLFNRGFSDKSGHEPRGFGLANVKEAVNELEGIVEVQSKPEEGSAFIVYLPKDSRGGQTNESG
ncbi:CitB family two-component system sensor histidine kinase CitS [Scopulibacillus daqui]|uniref:histidine kinase n=2 Tax=Scopulibacillus daqui TaxID=1469162 RepID=A0ABS2Q2V4_9BACL|nr:CitB family two-component system sensor histidine kinase CitS [Scopulibacillus daqui]